MILKSLFKKEIDRRIDGVIKADATDHLALEIEEYVLTNEIEQRLEEFLEAYINYAHANGGWISGFFGSGKSHLLKMLSFILGNDEIGGKLVVEYFLSKCADNKILSALLKKAASIPSKSILFNIDQKADAVSKQNTDALLGVFVKVFDEMCGYYGKQGYIAQFERELDSRGMYEGFKEAYKEVAGKDWKVGREQVMLEGPRVAKAYAKVSGEDESYAKSILDKYRKDYKLSIEDFANQVNQYIEQQEPNFRLNFFVDEVGQYIADNTKLMTNLQTVAESLATKCKGRAWIIVTSQGDMNAVVGDMTQQQGNDFSKIQARFANRMPLTSANVDEVIKKRLLMKTNEGAQALEPIYEAQRNNFKTLFTFADGSVQFNTYSDIEDFTDSYPFITYQFPLFQSVIQSLSAHNAFEGKHSSVGERSMLGVFQQVAIKIQEHELGQLATFDLMFEGIRTALKATLQTAINQAEQHVHNRLAVKLLKVLFLVKYVRPFKATARNLSILMYDRFDPDFVSFDKKVKEALNELESQTYIQRNGDLYEFLTDEEKDVEQEIKNTEVGQSDILKFLDQLFYGSVIKGNKIRHEDNRHDYLFTKKIDENQLGRERELSLNVITPFHELSGNQDKLQMLSSTHPTEVVIALPEDDRFLVDVKMLEQTKKYIQVNQRSNQRETVQRILSLKGDQNTEREDRLKTTALSLVQQATFYVNGRTIDVGSGDAKIRVENAFHKLMDAVYTNLVMLRGVEYKEQDIDGYILNAPQGDLLGDTATTLNESENAVFSFILMNKRNGVRTTLKSLIEHFSKKPFGWYQAAIQCNAAKLYAKGKVEMREESNPLENNDAIRALKNSHGFPNIVLEPQEEFTASQLRSLRDFYFELLEVKPIAKDVKGIGKELGIKIDGLVNEVNALLAQATNYPFVLSLKPFLEALQAVQGKEYGWYVKELKKHEDKLLDCKEDVFDKVKALTTGAQKKIFDAAYAFIHDEQHNLSQLEGDHVLLLKGYLASETSYNNGTIQKIKCLHEGLQRALEEKIAEERSAAIGAIEKLKHQFCEEDDYKKLASDIQDELCSTFALCCDKLGCEQFILNIRSRVQEFEESEYLELFAKAAQLAAPQVPKPKPSPALEATGGKTDSDGDKSSSPADGYPTYSPKDSGVMVVNEPTSPAPKVLSRKQIKVSYEGSILKTEDDLEAYLSAVREAWSAEIAKKNRIKI